MTESKGSRALMLPLMAGLLGAGLALLFAPRSGRETRQRLRVTADNMKQQADDGLAEIRESLDRSIHEAQDLKQRLATTMSNPDRKAKREMKTQDDKDKLQEPVESPVLSTWEEEV